jgi:uncharacterized protein YehS (DUF1456 family)
VTNNDILRRLRYTFDFDDSTMMELFELGDQKVSRSEVSDWLKADDNPDFKAIADELLAKFLNGLIIKKRGKQDGKTPIVENRLNNNIVLRKIKIAMNFKTEDIIDVLHKDGQHISKHEISSFFRRPEHRQYRMCKDQFLRQFLNGLQKTFRTA